MKIKTRWTWLLGLPAVLCLLMLPLAAGAADFDTYDTGSGYESTIELEEVSCEGDGGGAAGPSWFTAADYFPAGATGMVDGSIEVAGRLILATGNKIFLQRNYGSSVYDVVATTYITMDPGFIHPSPDGSKIALGLGYNKPLLIVPASLLSVSDPPALIDESYNFHAQVAAFDPYYIKYYDADWADNQYLVINGGSWPDGATPPYDPSDFASGCGVLDTDAADPWLERGRALITNIPGASSDIDVDAAGNVITGIGFGSGTTGQIKIWATGEWDPADPPGTPSLDYQTNTKIVCANCSSAAHLGTDYEGSLTFGGGDWAAGTDYGYAGLINHAVLSRVLTGGGPVDENNTAEYREFRPDPCFDDTSTGILVSSWGGKEDQNGGLIGTGNIAIMWNPDEGSGCKPHGVCQGDYWYPGVIPQLTLYHPQGANDNDGDNVPDGSDNAYQTSNSGQEDSNGDGWANIADADLDNDGAVGRADSRLFRQAYGSQPPTNPDADFNSDGAVGRADSRIFRERYGTEAPYY